MELGGEETWNSPRMKPRSNSLDLDLYVDLHQIANTQKYQSPKWIIFWEIKDNVKNSLTMLKKVKVCLTLPQNLIS